MPKLWITYNIVMLLCREISVDVYTNMGEEGVMTVANKHNRQQRGRELTFEVIGDIQLQLNRKLNKLICAP